MAGGGGFMNALLQPIFKRARGISEKEYRRGEDELRRGYGEAKGYWQPQYDFGQERLGAFKNWLADPNAVTQDPSYQWRLNQGTNALENSAAARGGLLSGNTARAVTDYAQGAASQEYGNQFDRWMQQLGYGQNATNALGGLASNEANALASLISRGGENWFNQTLQSAAEIRQAELGLNQILQDWIPAQFGGGGGSPGGGQSPMGQQQPGQGQPGQGGQDFFGSSSQIPSYSGDWQNMIKSWF